MINSFHISLGQLCLRSPPHRRRSVFTPLDYKDLDFLSSYDMRVPKTDRKSMLQEQTDQTRPWVWDSSCNFVYFVVIRPKLVVLMSTLSEG